MSTWILIDYYTVDEEDDLIYLVNKCFGPSSFFLLLIRGSTFQKSVISSKGDILRIVNIWPERPWNASKSRRISRPAQANPNLTQQFKPDRFTEKNINFDFSSPWLFWVICL